MENGEALDLKQGKIKSEFDWIVSHICDRACWAVVHGDCYVTTIVYLHKLKSIPVPGKCLLRNDHRGPWLNKYDLLQLKLSSISDGKSRVQMDQ